jgi:hypothetical protein
MAHSEFILILPVTYLEPQSWSLKKAAGARLSPLPGTRSAPGRFPASDCARDFWGPRAPPNAAPGAALDTGGARASRRPRGRLGVSGQGRRGIPLKALDGRGLPDVRSVTVGPPWGSDRGTYRRAPLGTCHDMPW